jgi:hypothetical protein
LRRCRYALIAPPSSTTSIHRLADVLARLPNQPAKRIHELLPWNWRRQSIAAEAA